MYPRQKCSWWNKNFPPLILLNTYFSWALNFLRTKNRFELKFAVMQNDCFLSCYLLFILYNNRGSVATCVHIPKPIFAIDSVYVQSFKVFLDNALNGYWAGAWQKPTKWHLRPAKTQISLGIRPLWSESLLCAQWVAKDSCFRYADSEDSDLTWRIPMLIRVFHHENMPM